jgi:hypothetical protein
VIIVHPRDGHTEFVISCFNQKGVMRPTREMDDKLVFFHLYGAHGIDEFPIDLFGVGILKSPDLEGE